MHVCVSLCLYVHVHAHIHLLSTVPADHVGSEKLLESWTSNRTRSGLVLKLKEVARKQE